MKQTKIVCTISDLRCDEDFIRSLFNEGMNVVRMNTAHATPEGLRKIIRNARAVSPHIGILIDTKGPEVRTTAVTEPISFKTGDTVKIIGCPDTVSTHDTICVTYPNLPNDVHVGDNVLFDDGAISMTVRRIDTQSATPTIYAEVSNDGILGARKSVNVPGSHIHLPSLTEKDKQNIQLAIDEDIDFIAHSFVRSADDVHDVQALLDEKHSSIKIISKIENQEGVDNIDEIIEASYGIMVARGDLGIEVPVERIPGIQRMLIRKCVERHKPVIVATQMLHTMLNSPRPTRAEVTDIANAIYSNTDALMLSGETASGKYPIEAVRTMATIAEQAEKDRQNFDPAYNIPLGQNCSQREFMAHSAIESTRLLGVEGIITASKSGYTARCLASYRGPKPILAICYNEKAQRWLNLSYGVIAVYQKDNASPGAIFEATLRMLRQKGYLRNEDKVAYLSGSIDSMGAGTTFLEINKVGEVFDKKYQFHLLPLQ